MTAQTFLRALRAQSTRLTRGGLVLLLAIGCTGTPTEPVGPPPDARLVGFLGEERFVARAEARIKYTPGAPDSLYLFAERGVPTRGTSEILGIRVELAGVGSYALSGSQVQFSVLIGGDGIASSRQGSSAVPGVLTLTALGATGELVTGTLRVLLTPSPEDSPALTPVEFTDGVFSVRLSDPIGSPAALR